MQFVHDVTSLNLLQKLGLKIVDDRLGTEVSTQRDRVFRAHFLTTETGYAFFRINFRVIFPVHGQS